MIHMWMPNCFLHSLPSLFMLWSSYNNTSPNWNPIKNGKASVAIPLQKILDPFIPFEIKNEASTGIRERKYFFDKKRAETDNFFIFHFPNAKSTNKKKMRKWRVTDWCDQYTTHTREMYYFLSFESQALSVSESIFSCLQTTSFLLFPESHCQQRSEPVVVVRFHSHLSFSVFIALKGVSTTKFPCVFLCVRWLDLCVFFFVSEYSNIKKPEGQGMSSLFFFNTFILVHFQFPLKKRVKLHEHTSSLSHRPCSTDIHYWFGWLAWEMFLPMTYYQLPCVSMQRFAHMHTFIFFHCILSYLNWRALEQSRRTVGESELNSLKNCRKKVQEEKKIAK